MKEKFDLMIQKITQDQDSNDILEAKLNYQKLAGEIYEDDKTFEARMGLFLEWYIFDHRGPGKEQTPLELFLAQNLDELKTGDDFILNINSIFVVKKIRADEVVVMDLLDSKKYNVRENESKILFNKNDLFEGRIILLEGDYYFTGNFCFHPRETEKFIKGEVKKIYAIKEVFLKELKQFNSQLKDLISKLEKNGNEIEKLNSKIENAGSIDKARPLYEKLDTLKIFRAELIQKISMKEAEKSNLETFKIKNEINALVSDLIQKLGYMNLKWERSRQIDIHDIYRN